MMRENCTCILTITAKLLPKRETYTDFTYFWKSYIGKKTLKCIKSILKNILPPYFLQQKNTSLFFLTWFSRICHLHSYASIYTFRSNAYPCYPQGKHSKARICWSRERILISRGKNRTFILFLYFYFVYNYSKHE